MSFSFQPCRASPAMIGPAASARSSRSASACAPLRSVRISAASAVGIGVSPPRAEGASRRRARGENGQRWRQRSPKSDHRRSRPDSIAGGRMYPRWNYLERHRVKVEGGGPMHSRSVLVVEDEAFVAIELASLLQRSGYRVLGPASTVQQALALLEDERPDAALLDLNLGSERVTAVAIELKSRNVPFVLVTGFADVREPELRFAPMLRKPVSDDGEVRRLLEAMLSPHSS